MEFYRKDLDDFCGILNQHRVDYLIIGGLAVNFHGFQRATGDIDIWYHPTQANFDKLLRAIEVFGFDTSEIRQGQTTDAKGFIRLLLDRYSIELLSNIDGKFSFEDAIAASESLTIINHEAKVLGYDHLVQNKIMARRPKDLEDVRQLEIRRQAREGNTGNPS